MLTGPTNTPRLDAKQSASTDSQIPPYPLLLFLPGGKPPSVGPSRPGVACAHRRPWRWQATMPCRRPARCAANPRPPHTLYAPPILPRAARLRTYRPKVVVDRAARVLPSSPLVIDRWKWAWLRTRDISIDLEKWVPSQILTRVKCKSGALANRFDHHNNVRVLEGYVGRRPRLLKLLE
jgi:hypothetical protein